MTTTALALCPPETLSRRERETEQLLAKIALLRETATEMAGDGFYIEGVDLSLSKPLIRVRHTRRCADLPAHLKTIEHAPDGERHIYRAHHRGCLVEWIELGPWHYAQTTEGAA